MITSSAIPSATSTRPRTIRLRFFVIKVVLWLRGRQDEQQSAVVVVCREDVGLRPLRPVSLRVNGDRLVENAHSPLERGADVVVARLELEAEHLLHRAADHVVVAEARELARTAAGADQSSVLVADEECGVGRRVVIVEQFEDEAEAALRAAARPIPESGGALAVDAAVSAVGADEVGHPLKA